MLFEMLSLAIEQRNQSFNAIAGYNSLYAPRIYSCSTQNT